MAVVSVLGVARSVGIGDAEARQDVALQPLPSLRRRGRSRDRSRADAEIHGRPDARDDARTACLRRPPRARSSRRRSTMSPSMRRRGPLARCGSAAGNDSTLVGLSMPRQSRLSARIAESSVEHDSKLGRRRCDGVGGRRGDRRRDDGLRGRRLRVPAAPIATMTSIDGAAPSRRPRRGVIPSPSRRARARRPCRRPRRCAPPARGG